MRAWACRSSETRILGNVWPERGWLGWGLTLCLLFSTCFLALGREYEVDGEIVQTLFKVDGSVQVVRLSKFTVFVRDCSWLIQTTDHDDRGRPLVLRETACLDGAEICEVSSRAGLMTSNTTLPAVTARNMATVVSNTVPVGMLDDYFVCHLWLMFASSCYFSNLSTNWLTPVYDLNASAAVDPQLKCEAKWHLLGGPGSLPLSVAYLRSPRFTNATYVATGVTNADGMPIPIGFVFEQRVGARFAPGTVVSGDPTAVYRIRKFAVATVTAVRSACSRTDLLPRAGGRTVVVDQRLPRPAPGHLATYSVRTGAQWVSVEVASNLYASEHRSKARPAAHRQLGLVFIPLGVLVCAPIAVWSIWLFRGRSKARGRFRKPHMSLRNASRR
jgi:hypothetical protein